MRFAVVGHVEWVEFATVARVPLAGEIIDAERSFAQPAGGGGVAAVQLARLAGSASFYTALGDDALGEASRTGLAELGVTVYAERSRGSRTRRAFTFLDADAERTITTIGERVAPSGSDRLPWDELASADAVYVTAGDADALARARSARVLVATPRAGSALAGVAIDAIVYSAGDALEREEASAVAPAPALIVATEGREGGSWRAADGTSGRWSAAAPPGPIVDYYGAGDSFAAGLTYALGAGKRVADAVALAARCGAWCTSGRGPYTSQLAHA